MLQTIMSGIEDNNTNSTHLEQTPTTLPSAHLPYDDPGAIPAAQDTRKKCHDIERGKEEADAIDTTTREESTKTSCMDGILPPSTRKYLKGCCCCDAGFYSSQMVYQSDGLGGGYYMTLGDCLLQLCCIIWTTVVLVGIIFLIVRLTIRFGERTDSGGAGDNYGGAGDN
jgi:hypothetical protein